ncbi:hypothetical protein KIPE111705_08540 [Kibdelosporangium persicum]|uniref:DAGKc domain-containing protein n=1 Tax=Kibdelosporangium persicum TaxID=2698649 RepID=A0ABX2EYN7_9PSEU|nr:hypothetical protein [Kibdelosporangium persicum]NRN63795.1 DAGKc domain-containing protein [Kibdelosporangium persicum]
MGALVLACGDSAGHGRWTSLTQRDDVEVRAVPSNPARPDVDPLLKDLSGRRLAVLGTDADLAAVVLRVLRKELVDEITVGFVPVGDSWVADLWGLPPDTGKAIEVALRGDVDPIPLIRDDAGGVLVGLGRIGPTRGVAYCDDTTALRGGVSGIEVTPDPSGRNGLIVRVIRRGLLGKRVTEFRGRAFQLGSLPVNPVKDGVTHPRPTQRWTWYRHTSDLRVARGVI